MNVYLSDLGKIAPEAMLTFVACAALVYDLVRKGRDSRYVGYLTLGGLALTGLLLIFQWGSLSDQSGPVVAFGVVSIDHFGAFFKLFTVAALAVVAVFVLSDRNEKKHHVGEYYFLLLGAAIGIFFMVSTTNLLLLVLGIELLSLASYALAGFHKGSRRSAEAAIKYVIYGGLSAGIMLYGISLLYGLTGTIDLHVMAGVGDAGQGPLADQLVRNPVPAAIGLVMVLAGFGFKVSIVPFHWWTPDVYEGAPTPVTTFLAVASKAAGFGVFLRFLGALFLVPGVDGPVATYGERIGLLLAILAGLTMTLGNLSALRQASLKRMLAYSSIAHAGYVLMGLAAMSEQGFSAAMFYLAAYYLMNLGAFGVLLYFEGVTGSDSVESLRGMGARAPLVSVAMIVFLVSLTGLPPTVGFYGKYLLIFAVWNGPTWGPVLILFLAANTVVSLFYYFRVARALFLDAPAERESAPQPGFVGLLAALAVATVVLGLLPRSLATWADRGSESLGIEEPF